MIRLPEHVAEELMSKPETGMDYQIVDLVMKNGIIIRDCVVSAGVVTSKKEGFLPNIKSDEIETAILTHNKW